jgi:hypothetical protein
MIAGVRVRSAPRRPWLNRIVIALLSLALCACGNSDSGGEISLVVLDEDGNIVGQSGGDTSTPGPGDAGESDGASIDGPATVDGVSDLAGDDGGDGGDDNGDGEDDGELPAECKTTHDCLDGIILSPCTEAHCVEEKCVFEFQENCCENDTDCADENPCTANGCNPANNQCIVKNIEGCCSQNIQCDDGDECTVDTCTSDPETGLGFCAYSDNENCCKALLDNHFSEPKALAGWKLYKPNNEISWQVWDKRYASPPSSLYMGDPLKANYVNYVGSSKNQMRSRSAIYTPYFTVPNVGSETILRFKLWFDIENCEDNGPKFDLFTVGVVLQGSQEIIPLITKCDIPEPWKAWQELAFELNDFKGETISVVFDFDSKDEKFNYFEGIYIDDLEISNCGF